MCETFTQRFCQRMPPLVETRRDGQLRQAAERAGGGRVIIRADARRQPVLTKQAAGD